MLKDEDTRNTFKRHTKHLKLQYMTEMLFTLYEILKKKKKKNILPKKMQVIRIYVSYCQVELKSQSTKINKNNK